jgi:tetratricopeptide (TPR) repeat protein
MQNYTDAEPLIRESLQWYRDHVGEGHVRTIEMYLGVAKFETDAGRLQEAEFTCRTTLAAYILHFGKDHSRTSEVATQLGQILVARQRYAEAEPLLRQAHEIRQRALPHTHWERAKTATLLGAALAGLGRCPEAGPLVLDNFPLIRADRGENHRRTAEAMDRIVFVCEHCGEPEEAAEWRRRRSEHPFEAP